MTPRRGAHAGAPVDPALAARIAALFPPGVQVAVSALDGREEELLPAERALLARAAGHRRVELATGRRLAREVLARLGIRDFALLRGDDGGPRWPPGTIGSLSHGAGCCVVVAARGGALVGLGVDVEGDAPLAPRLRARISTDAERAALAALPEASAGRRGKIAFCAKEAAIKCLRPVLGRPLVLTDVEVGVDEGRGRLRLALRPERAGPLPPGLALGGAFLCADGRVFAAAVLGAARAEPRGGGGPDPDQTGRARAGAATAPGCPSTLDQRPERKRQASSADFTT